MQVYLDRGSGSSYLGLYTMVEVPDDPFLELMFGSDEGNLYKPHSTGGRWTVFDKDDFPKKTNEFDEDWTDIQGAIAALNASKLDRASWRQRLEARFDVNGISAMAGVEHHRCEHGRLRWSVGTQLLPVWKSKTSGSIVLDSVGSRPGHVHRRPRRGGAGEARRNVDLFHAGINASWPLIRFFMDDPVYRATYRAHVESLLGTVFEPVETERTIAVRTCPDRSICHRRER
jgi:hypothetical protein